MLDICVAKVANCCFATKSWYKRQKTPYLYRRRNNLYFRITVPTDILPILGLLEITRTLNTQHFNQAVPQALMLGDRVLTIFNKVRVLPRGSSRPTCEARSKCDSAKALKKAACVRVLASKSRAIKVMRVIEKARHHGANSLQSIADYLSSETSTRIAKGSLWTRTSIKRVLANHSD